MALTPSDPIPLKFLLSADQAQNTQWKWKKGDGELCVEGERLTLSGRRLRPFMFARAQTVTFDRSQVVDVTRVGNSLYAAINMDGRKPEPLNLQFATEEMAMQVAALLPKVRSGAALEQEAFAKALERRDVQVWVTPAMAAICVLVFIAMALDGVPVVAPHGPELIPWGTNFGPRTLAGEPWRLYTAVFLHFGFQHLMLNMISLLSLGPMTERLLGNGRFLVVYVTAGLCGSIVSLWWNPGVNSAGASGAIFGVMGALLAIMFHPRSGVPPGIARSSRNAALLFLGVNLLNSLRPGIDMAAHLGGLGAGLLLGWLFVRPLAETDEPPARDSAIPGMTAAVLLIALLAGRVFNHSDEFIAVQEFRASLMDYYNAEDAATAREQQLRALANNGTISRKEWAERILAEVVPLWDKAMDAAMLMPVGSEKKQAEVADLLRKYSTSQVLEFQLFAESILEDDHFKSAYGNQIHQKQQVRRKLAQLMIADL